MELPLQDNDPTEMDFADIGSAKLDIHRETRTGIPEVIFGPGKSALQVAEIAQELVKSTDGAVLVTRATAEQFAEVRRVLPESEYFQDPGVIVVRRTSSEPLGVALVVSAGTADQSVAEEAAITLEALGAKVERLRDVGVAGVHRLLASQDAIQRADVIVVVAGMDGALVSVVGGLAAAPVVAVPTSVGYGAGADGIAPLLTMLNSCSPGVAVVNIDNGFGAAAFAIKMLRRRR